MTDAQALRNIAGGIADNGSSMTWRIAFSRHQRDFQQIVNDPTRGPWNRTLSDGQVHPGHTDAYEQIVPINEQVSWRHVFSDGIERDMGDVLLELMEFAIQWRTANHVPTSAFVQDAAARNGIAPRDHSREEGRKEGCGEKGCRQEGVEMKVGAQ